MSEPDFMVGIGYGRNMYKYLYAYDRKYRFHFENHSISDKDIKEIEELLEKKVEQRFEFDEHDPHLLYMYIGDRKVKLSSDQFYRGVSMPTVVEAMAFTDLAALKSAYEDLAQEYNDIKSELVCRCKHG